MLHEDTITAKLVDILETLRSAWNVEPQNTQTFLREGQRPDITVKENGRDPVVIEIKIDRSNTPDLSGEAQAREHLGRQLTSYERVSNAMALRLPHWLRGVPHRELEDKLRGADDLHYVLLSGDNPQDVHRFPNDGWIKASLTDVATAIRIGAIPISKVTKAAYDLEHGVNETALLLEAAIHERPEIGRQIEEILHQETCEQTSRMAMLIITNAFVFQSSLSHSPGLETVPSLGQLRDLNERLNLSQILEAWNQICQVNYRPIFDVAARLVDMLASDDRLVGRVLYLLRNTAQKLIDRGLAQVHELAGIVFQRLTVDRKFIKTYYTRPESVALLSALVLPDVNKINSDYETIRQSLSELKVADFACGTGALLNGVYQRILTLYEQTNGNGRDIHKHMVENNLVGCDIMPNASHLTAALIASNFPDVKIGNTCIDVMEYGTQRPDGAYALGALDWIEDPEGILPIGLINTQRVQGGASDGDTPRHEFRHGKMDIVVDNPPFTRAGADNNAADPDIPKTLFGDRDPTIAAEMKRRLRNINDSIGHSGHLASYFVDLADKALKPNGQSVMGFVLPVTVLTSPDWWKVRQLWKSEYHNIVVVTIADAKTNNCAFSADTNMAECLIIATKGKSKNTGRGMFVCLHRRPNGQLEALEIAKNIHLLRKVRQFEEPPIGGNSIKVGDEIVGSVLNCPLPELWATTRIRDLSLIQSAYHITNGRLWLSEQSEPLKIPMTTVGQIAEVGFDNKMITGNIGAFDIENGCSNEDSYPGLWHVNSDEQRAMVVQPDCHCIIRSNRWDNAQRVLARNGRVHHMAKLRYNANSLAVLFTKRPTIGVNTLPNVVFEKVSYDYVWTLWGNSTLGLLCYWMHANKQHSGRGQIRLKALRLMPTLDVEQLDEAALQNAKRIFDEIKHKKMLPFNQMDEDNIRHELDRRLLSEVLGFDEETYPDIHEGLRILRERLCAEPSIHGGKKSRVVLPDCELLTSDNP